MIEFGQEKQLKHDTRFGYSNVLDLSPIGSVDPMELNGYGILSTAEYSLATPHTIIDLQSIRESISAAIKSGDLARVIAEYEDFKNKHPDPEDEDIKDVGSKWETAIRFRAKPVIADGKEIPTFIEVRSFFKELKFKALGFGVYRDVGTGIIDTEPQKLAVVHLTKL